VGEWARAIAEQHAMEQAVDIIPRSIASEK